MTVYLISGLGADERIFQWLDLSPWKVIPLPWLIPEATDSIPDYAQKLSTRIDASEPFVLIGLSFGGVIAQEVARWVAPQQTILLSSFKGHHELPPWIRRAGRWRAHRLLPVSWLKTIGNKLTPLFSLKTNAFKQVYYAMLADSDVRLLNWSIDRLLAWRNLEPDPSVIHIHGTRDRLLPYRFVHATHAIPGAGHMAVAEHAAEISTLLRELIPIPSEA
ncbi:MAG: alpha/beta hydrolase [Bacteroidota bacterium]